MPATAPTTADSRVQVTLAQLEKLRLRTQGFSLLPRQPIHSLLAGRRASRLRGRGLNFEEIRRYQPGDDIRQIDWKVTVRTRKTHSRVYTEERERTVLLLVDQRRSMFFGSVHAMKSVTAAETAALAAWRALSQQDRVGALVFNDTDIAEIRPQRSQTTVLRILRAIVDQNNDLATNPTGASAPSRLDDALRQAERLAKHDCLVCVITDGAGSGPETRAALTRIAAHNDVIVASVRDPLEAELPAAGRLVCGDGRNLLEVDTSAPALRQRYRDGFAADAARDRRLLAQRETPVLPVTAAEPVPSQLRRFLGGLRQ